jgi:hypothetical protein
MIIKQKVEAIAIIAKMDNGKYYQIRTLKDNEVQILNYLAALTKSGALELLDNELESIEF